MRKLAPETFPMKLLEKAVCNCNATTVLCGIFLLTCSKGTLIIFFDFKISCPQTRATETLSSYCLEMMLYILEWNPTVKLTAALALNSWVLELILMTCKA